MKHDIIDDTEEEEKIVSIEENKNIFNDWKNPPKVSDLKNDFEEATPSHNAHVSQIAKWTDNLNGTGSAAIKSPRGKSSIVPRLIRKQAEWRYSSLSEPFLSSDDLYDVDPVTYEDKEGAIQNALVLNNQFNTKIDKVKFIDEYVRTAVDEGTVIVRVGWDFEEEEQDVEVPVYAQVPVPMAPEQGLPPEMGGQLPLDPSLAGLEPPVPQQGFPEQAPVEIQEIQIGTKIEKQMVTIKNQPTLYVCDHRNVVIDPTCEGDLSKANFIIYSFETSLSELKKDSGKYKNLDKVSFNNTENSILAEADHNSSDESHFNFKDKPRKKVVAREYWGYWDYDKTGIVKPIVATYIGDTMIRLEEAPFPDKKLPFVAVQYLPMRKSIYGEPDGALLEDNQKIIGAVTRGIIDTMARSANGQMGRRKDALDVTNQRKFDKGMDYDFNSHIDPRQAFYMHQYPEIPQSAQYMINTQNNDAESMTGVKAFHDGISGQALGATATGVRSAMDAASKREIGILRRLAAGVIEIGRKIVAMNAEFLDDVEIVRVTNEEFVPIRKDDLPGNYDLKITISTAETDNEKAQELAFMLQTMGNSMDPAMSQMILADIARLRNMPTLAKKIATYQPQPNPMAEKQAELQLALLEAQVYNEQAKGRENETDIGLKQAKTETEQAKAKNLSSDADLKDLDFISKDKGIEHDREMEKKGMERNIQLDLKAADKMIADSQRSQEKQQDGLTNINKSL